MSEGVARTTARVKVERRHDVCWRSRDAQGVALDPSAVRRWRRSGATPSPTERGRGARGRDAGDPFCVGSSEGGLSAGPGAALRSSGVVVREGTGGAVAKRGA